MSMTYQHKTKLPYLKIVDAEIVEENVSLKISEISLVFEGAAMRNQNSAVFSLQNVILKHLTRSAPSSILDGRTERLSRGLNINSSLPVFFIENPYSLDLVVSGLIFNAFVHNGLRHVTKVKSVPLAPVPSQGKVYWRPITGSNINRSNWGANEPINDNSFDNSQSIIFPKVPVDDGVVLCIEVVARLIQGRGNINVDGGFSQLFVCLGCCVLSIMPQGEKEDISELGISNKIDMFPSQLPCVFAPELNPVICLLSESLPVQNNIIDNRQKEIGGETGQVGNNSPKGRSSSLSNHHQDIGGTIGNRTKRYNLESSNSINGNDDKEDNYGSNNDVDGFSVHKVGDEKNKGKENSQEHNTYYDDPFDSESSEDKKNNNKSKILQRIHAMRKPDLRKLPLVSTDNEGPRRICPKKS